MVYLVDFLLEVGAFFGLGYLLVVALVHFLPPLLFHRVFQGLTPSRFRQNRAASLAALPALFLVRGRVVTARALTRLFELFEAHFHFIFLNHFS